MISLYKYNINLIILLFISTISNGIQAQSSDSIVGMTYDIEEVTVAAIKQSSELETEPLSKTIISIKDIELQRTQTIKEASALAPNVYIPDYGSRITSSIYVRGIGSRIDNPVIGLNIDNVPYLNKNTFDNDVTDISRIELLRGPQSTVYGRNSLGGVINIYTISPFKYQGLKLSAQASNGNSYQIKTSYHAMVNDKLAYSAALAINSTDGFFKNKYTNELLDWENSYSARLKLKYHPKSNTQIENTAALNIIFQGGYPYENISTNTIAYNDTSSYRRVHFSDAVTVRHILDWGEIASITSYSYLGDKMTLDQDFTVHDYFTLQQKTREHYVTEDLSIKLNYRNDYKALFGFFGMFKSLSMDAPVNFKEYGIDNLILKNMNEQISPYYYTWNSDQFCLNSSFNNSIFNAAIYHESSYEHNRWKASISIRADIEHSILRYASSANSSATLYDDNNSIYNIKEIDINKNGKPSQTFFVFLPKATALYKLGTDKESTIYASVGMGHKAGGFNTQMFSDILQQDIMTQFGIGSEYDVDEVITYKPEYNLCYEIGSHLELNNKMFILDMALYYIDAFNQQLTVFPEGETTGRLMTNAGRSRSFGGEVSANISPSAAWDINVSYGYTNAKFIKYKSGNDDYAGKYVPYAPQHTLYLGVNYALPIGSDKLIFDVNSNGVGKIYWNEQNSINQPFYMLLNASVNYESKYYSLSIWGKNITNTQYSTFYFKSIGREFVQRGRKTTYGITLKLNI